MGAETDMIAALLGSATGLEIFEELRFVWEYLAAAALLLATQASARDRGLYRGAVVLVAFSLLSLGYFPYKDALTHWMPRVWRLSVGTWASRLQ